MNEELNKERFVTHAGEMDFLDNDGNILKGEEVKGFLAEEKRQQELASVEKYLPIGTIVELNDSQNPSMILGFNIKSTDGNTYDYSGCTYPEGITSLDELKMFNHDQINRIYHIGYVNLQEKIFKSKLKESTETNNNKNNIK